jgi:aspartate racemase
MTGAVLGVLGGMGPLAAADFVTKLVERTPAATDQDHVPVVLYSVPQVPDRNKALAGTGPSPVPAMLAGLRVLEAAGAQRIAIACNTAHHWHGELSAGSRVPIFHIADAVAASLAERLLPAGPVGLIATGGTLAAGFYQERLLRHGFTSVTPDARDLETLVMPGVYDIKRGDLAGGGKLFETAIDKLRQRGARQTVLACTEVPVGLAAIASTVLPDTIDATSALVDACVRWWLERRSQH